MEIFLIPYHSYILLYHKDAHNLFNQSQIVTFQLFSVLAIIINGLVHISLL